MWLHQKAERLSTRRHRPGIHVVRYDGTPCSKKKISWCGSTTRLEDRLNQQKCVWPMTRGSGVRSPRRRYCEAVAPESRKTLNTFCQSVHVVRCAFWLLCHTPKKLSWCGWSSWGLIYLRPQKCLRTLTWGLWDTLQKKISWHSSIRREILLFTWASGA